MDIQGYTIQREIGKGGMATVYLAVQESLHRHVVLKILDDVKLDKSEDLGERFLAEQLDSIVAQTHKNWRILARDDSSTDGTPAARERSVPEWQYRQGISYSPAWWA